MSARVLALGGLLVLGASVRAAEPDPVGPPAELQGSATPQAAASPASAPPVFVAETRGEITLWRPSTVVDGQLLVLELALPRRCSKPRVVWERRLYTLYAVADRFHALVPVKLGLEPGARPLRVRCSGRDTSFEVPVTAGEFPESKLSVDPKFSSAPPPRVAAESAKIKQAWTKGRHTKVWTDSFVRPAAGITTSPFGVRRTFNGVVDSRHRGTDFDGKVGDPIVSPNDGVVVLAADDFYYTGNAIFLDHGAGLFTQYFHMSRVDVKEGEHVERGQLLGLIGSTGRVTGPHLHFGVKLGNEYVNPMDLLRYEPKVLGGAREAGATGR